jgi:hypothetical protein
MSEMGVKLGPRAASELSPFTLLADMRRLRRQVRLGNETGTVKPMRLPSRPGEFHPEPLTDSGREPLDSSGSCHRAKAAAFH